MQITQLLAEFGLSMSFQQLPGEAVDKAKLLMLDSMGCALGSYSVERGRIAVEFADELGGKTEAHIIGGRKTSCCAASFANGELINAMDFDALNLPPGHSCAYVLPPCFAIGESVHASGKDLITAAVLAQEIAGRVTGSIAQLRLPTSSPPYYEESPRFTHASSLFGGVAGACRLLGLNAIQTANAFGIAGASVPVPAGTKWEHLTGPHVMTKYNAWAGWASLLGVTTALIARKGFTGDTSIFDGDDGFWKIVGSPFFKRERLTGGLGKTWHINNVQFKAYPVCGANHAGIDGIRRIMQENELKPEEIAEIVIKGDPLALTPNRAGDVVESFADTQFRNSYICAVAAYHGDSPGPHWQLPSTFNDERIRALMGKVRTESHERAGELIAGRIREGKLGKFENTVVEITARCRKFSCEVAIPRGRLGNPLTEEELKAKFRDNARYSAITAKKSEEALGMLSSLEELKDVSELFTRLGTPD